MPSIMTKLLTTLRFPYGDEVRYYFVIFTITSLVDVNFSYFSGIKATVLKSDNKVVQWKYM